MIGKPKWFTYRILGWGVRPSTWQGWTYLIVWAAILASLFSLAETNTISIWFGIAAIIVLGIDVIHIMTMLPKHHDERENHHQLIIERNCSFAAVIALLGVAIYQTYQNGLTNSVMPFDWWILAVLGAMLFTKIASHVYTKIKM